jgi:hypothetical protein
MLDNSPLGRATTDTTTFYDDEFCRLVWTSSFRPCSRVCVLLALKRVSFEHDKRGVFFDRSRDNFFTANAENWNLTSLSHLFPFLHQTATFTFRYNRVVRLNMDSCSKRTVHSTERLPRTIILKRAANLLKNFIFKRRCVTEESQSANCRGKLACAMCESVSICWGHIEDFCFVLFFCFRSRSRPVPHRGERVKQRTVHLRNWKHSYVNCKILHFRWTILFATFLDNFYVPVSFFVCVCRSLYFHSADFL